MDSQSPQTELAALREARRVAAAIVRVMGVPTPCKGGNKAIADEIVGGLHDDYFIVKTVVAAIASRPSPLVDTGEALREAGRRYMDAVKAVFAIDPTTKKCFAEGSPTKDQETYERFIELNDAGVAFSAALAAHPKPEVPRAASASDIAKLLDDPRIKAAVRVSGECPDCLRKADRCTCPKPEESN